MNSLTKITQTDFLENSIIKTIATRTTIDSTTSSYSFLDSLEINLEKILTNKTSRNEKEYKAQIDAIKNEIAAIILDIIEQQDSVKTKKYQYGLDSCSKFAIEVQIASDNILLTLKNSKHSWFSDNQQIKICNITKQNTAKSIAIVKKQLLENYFDKIMTTILLSVDKNGHIAVKGTNFFYAKPLLIFFHYIYQNENIFIEFCKYYEIEKLCKKILYKKTEFYSENDIQMLKDFAEDELAHIRYFYFHKILEKHYSLFEEIYEISKVIIKHQDPAKLFKDFFEILLYEAPETHEAILNQIPPQNPQMVYTLWYYNYITITSIMCIQKYQIPFYRLLNKSILGHKIDIRGDRLIFEGMLNFFAQNAVKYKQLLEAQQQELMINIIHKITFFIPLERLEWNEVFDFYYNHCKVKKNIKLYAVFQQLSESDLNTGEQADWYGLFLDLSKQYPETLQELLPKHYHSDTLNKYLHTLSGLGKQLIQRYMVYKTSSKHA